MEYQCCHSGRRAIQFRYAGSYPGYLKYFGARRCGWSGRIPRPDDAVFRYPAVGVHAWRYWPDQVLKMLRYEHQPG